MAAHGTQQQRSEQENAGSFDSLEEPVTETSPSSSRKKRVNVEEHARTKRKRRLHSGEGKTPTISCTHPIHSYCKARTLTGDEITYNFNKLYDCSTKVDQDKCLLSLVRVEKSKKKRVDEGARVKKKTFNVDYYLLTKENIKVTVCKSSFTSVLVIRYLL